MAASRALCIALVLASIVPASARAADQIVLRDAGPVGALVRSDGERYIASARSAIAAPVEVLDTATGLRPTIASPEGCVLVDAHDATLLWACATQDAFASGKTYNLATGSRTELPAPEHDLGSADASSYEAIGERWARVRFSSYHSGSVAWIERGTGLMVTADPGAAFVPDLDRAELMRPLCPGVRRATVPDASSGLGVVLADDLAYAGPWAASTSYDEVENPPGVVELQHCDRAPRTLTICRHVQCSQPVITTGFVAWTENDRRGRLVVRSLATGRIRTASRAAPLTPLLVGRRLYVIAHARLLRVAL